jgi:hypothetical protein
VSNRLKCPTGGWETPLVRKIEHVYLKKVTRWKRFILQVRTYEDSPRVLSSIE